MARVRNIVLFANSLFALRRPRDLQDVLQVFERAHIRVEVLETGAHRAAGPKAKRAVERGVDAIVVCGGDGTVFDVLQGIAGSRVPIGIIPLGTGNILAQNLSIPKRPADAARWLLRTQPTAVPLGKITCPGPGGTRPWFFAMSAGLGVHAAMMEATHRDEKDCAGRAAYVGIGLRALLFSPIQPFALKLQTVDGRVCERHASEAIALRVAKLNVWRPGGDLRLDSLRLATVDGSSRWRLARASAEALLLGDGRRDRARRVGAAARYEDVTRVDCRPIPGFQYRSALSVQADGEVIGHSWATIEMAGLSVNLLSPPDSAPRG